MNKLGRDVVKPASQDGGGKPSEKKKHIVAVDWGSLFERYEVDKSGQLDFEEVKMLLMDILPGNVSDNFLEAHAANLFTELDIDASGQVDCDEFIAYVKSDKQLAGKLAKMNKSGRDVVKPASQDGGGKPSEKKKHIVAVDWGSLFERYEVDKSGQLDFEEVKMLLMDILPGNVSDNFLEAHAANLFTELDIDAS